MSATKTKDFSFDGFANSDVMEEGFEFPVLRTDGTESGMRIRVAGPGSKRRKDAIASYYDKRKSRANLTADEINELVLSEYIAATLSWSFPDGFNGPKCTPEEVRAIYTKHMDIYQQAQEAANKLANFTKASRTK